MGYKTPYRLQGYDNPYDFGRLTMPRGALYSGQLPGGPSTVPAGMLGGQFGTAPPPAPPNPFSGITGAFGQIGNALNRTWQGIFSVGAAAVQGNNNPFIPAFSQGVHQNIMPGQTGIQGVPPPPAGSQMPWQQSVIPPYSGNLPSPFNVPSYAGQNFPRAHAMNLYETVGRTSAELKQVILAAKSRDDLPPTVGIYQANALNIGDYLVRNGYRLINSVYFAPNYNPAGAGGGAPQQPTMARYGHGNDPTKLASAKWVEGWRKRQMRGGGGGGQNRGQKQQGQFQAYGLVNFNSSAG